MADSPVTINLEFTPNPNTLKFVLNKPLLERGGANFLTVESARHAPLAERLLKIPGVGGIMIGTNFVTVTRGKDGSWDTLADEVPKGIQNHFREGLPVFLPEFLEARAKEQIPTANASELENKIKSILDSEIRPAVAMDGGDIVFDRFENGVVYLHLQGSCSSCPSSIATLKMGVETRLREAIPEILEVVQV